MNIDMDETEESMDMAEVADITEAVGAMEIDQTEEDKNILNICLEGIFEWPAFHFKWNHQPGNGIAVFNDCKELSYPCPSYRGCPDTNHRPGAWGTPFLPRNHPSKWLLRITVDDLKGSDSNSKLCEVGLGKDFSKATEGQYIESVWPVFGRLEPPPHTDNKFFRDIAFMYEPKESQLYFLFLKEVRVFTVCHCAVEPGIDLWPLVRIFSQCDYANIKISILEWNEKIHWKENPNVIDLDNRKI